MSLTNASPEAAAKAAKVSSRTLATLSVDARNSALDAIYDALSSAREEILAANATDLELAKKSTANGELNPSIFKRLDLGRKGKFDDMLQGIKDVKGLEDPGMYDRLLDLSSNPSIVCLGVISILMVMYSRQNRPPNRTRRWSNPPTTNLPHRRPPNHLRSPSRSHR